MADRNQTRSDDPGIAEPQISGIPISKFGTHDALTAKLAEAQADLVVAHTRLDVYRSTISLIHGVLARRAAEGDAMVIAGITTMLRNLDSFERETQ